MQVELCSIALCPRIPVIERTHDFRKGLVTHRLSHSETSEILGGQTEFFPAS